MAGPSAVGYDFMPSKTPVPYWSPCASTCTFASPQGMSLPLNQMNSVGVNPMTHQYIKSSRFPADIPVNVRIPGRETPGRGRAHAVERRPVAGLVFPGRIERHALRTGTCG